MPSRNVTPDLKDTFFGVPALPSVENYLGSVTNTENKSFFGFASIIPGISYLGGLVDTESNTFFGKFDEPDSETYLGDGPKSFADIKFLNQNIPVDGPSYFGVPDEMGMISYFGSPNGPSGADYFGDAIGVRMGWGCFLCGNPSTDDPNAIKWDDGQDVQWDDGQNVDLG